MLGIAKSSSENNFERFHPFNHLNSNIFRVSFHIYSNFFFSAREATINFQPVERREWLDSTWNHLKNCHKYSSLSALLFFHVSHIFAAVERIGRSDSDWVLECERSLQAWNLSTLSTLSTIVPHSRSIPHRLYMPFSCCVCCFCFLVHFFGVELLRNSNRWNWFKGFLMNANEAVNVLSHNNRLKPHTIILENLCSSPLVKRETIDRKSLKVPFLVSISIEL